MTTTTAYVHRVLVDKNKDGELIPTGIQRVAMHMADITDIRGDYRCGAGARIVTCDEPGSPQPHEHFLVLETPEEVVRCFRSVLPPVEVDTSPGTPAQIQDRINEVLLRRYYEGARKRAKEEAMDPKRDPFTPLGRRCRGCGVLLGLSTPHKMDCRR